jgi:demethylmenaquinone methyltransferase/2-methoxy-6-polyprenyl-1,4-benzoquinol methylase
VSNTFYAPGDQRAAKVNDLFAAIARRYDLLNDLQSFGLHRLWKRRVVELAKVEKGNRALDLCCGTGDISFALAKNGAETIGLDFSPQMLEVAESRRPETNRKSQIANLKFLEGDAQQIPFPENSFDIVTVGYGLRNLASWERGLEEMLRVAKPGARLVVLEFGKPENLLWRKIYFTHRPAVLRQPAGLRLHFGIAQALSGATGRRRKNARAETRQRARDQPPRRRDGDQLCGKIAMTSPFSRPADSARHIPVRRQMRKTGLRRNARAGRPCHYPAIAPTFFRTWPG